ncbi:DUF2637 domain-containing protein, partial [Streptomyces noursei]
HAVGRMADLTADKHMEGVRLARWLLAFPSTFRLWRRMKLWELRSYDQVIRLEQDRLVYQARLRARYGRNWRRRAPVESLMPLRLARYGVPLAETAPAGLTAAGIEPPAVAPLPAPVPAALPLADDTAEQPGHPEEESNPAPAEVSTRNTPERTVAAADLADAFRAYITQYRSYPNSRQLGLYLADAHGITDPETGGPLTEAALRPALQELRREHLGETGVARDVIDPKPESEQWTMADAGHTTYSNVAEYESATNAAAAPMAPLPEPVPTASATGEQRAYHQVAPAIGQGESGQVDVEPAARPATIPSARVPDTTVRPAQWGAAASDTGAATVRKPQSQEQELEAGDQRIEQVVQWLIEAETANTKLSGAEVARRLEVAARTGQRAIAAAREIKEARERETSQQRRGHLRSVADRR